MAGRCSKQGIDLEKQLARLSQERHTEEVACWRDTNRLLETRPTRLADYGQVGGAPFITGSYILFRMPY